ncbi:MAG: flagellar motor protein MotB [Desulfuromonas sp.]|uniref:OmpA/MotB family protein n=1 Tax=Desulfuromonas sp. TaxID=892 RepID=UPI000CBF6BA6|nr:flagellar motor protein MotB [Desulfuromonas sp.]PLX84488.1 MAG: flagellar motor protein MotB [Desulfuromonas sp.]
MARKPKKASAGAPLWMTTFSDLVTLLLCFFVLMLSMARLDKMKFEDAAGSLKGAFGVLKGGDKTDLPRPKVVDFVPIQDDFVTRVYKRVATEFNRLKIDRRIDLVKDRGAVILRVNEAILFGSGQTRVKQEAYPVLRDIAGLIRNLPLHLRIEGHTDSIRPTSKEMSNWDISVARAISVLKAFESEKLLPLDRMSAVGYGSQRPLAAGESPQEKALNRRVEFVLESIGGHREDLPFLIDAKDQLPF